VLVECHHVGTRGLEIGSELVEGFGRDLRCVRIEAVLRVTT
jgi:hypothetical protein